MFQYNFNQMKIFEDAYHEQYFDEVQSLYVFTWKEEDLPSSFDDKDYQEMMLRYADFLEKYHPKKLIVDSRSQTYVISPEMQQWTDNNIFVRVLKAGLRRVAIIVSKEFIAELSLEQVMETESGMVFKTNYFTDKADALAWMRENEVELQ